jgi:hypothetical protein
MPVTRATERRSHLRAIATEYVNLVAVSTGCARCGGIPIEWHREHHPKHPNSRVSSLRTQGASIERIQREMDSCIPLCRTCHMNEDGRLAALHAAKPRQKGAVITRPSPCLCCARPTKPFGRDVHNLLQHHTGIRLRGTSCDGCCRPTADLADVLDFYEVRFREDTAVTRLSAALSMTTLMRRPQCAWTSRSGTVTPARRQRRLRSSARRG